MLPSQAMVRKAWAPARGLSLATLLDCHKGVSVVFVHSGIGFLSEACFKYPRRTVWCVASP
jgi:hypothetical protein